MLDSHRDVVGGCSAGAGAVHDAVAITESFDVSLCGAAGNLSDGCRPRRPITVVGW